MLQDEAIAIGFANADENWIAKHSTMTCYAKCLMFVSQFVNLFANLLVILEVCFDAAIADNYQLVPASQCNAENIEFLVHDIML